MKISEKLQSRAKNIKSVIDFIGGKISSKIKLENNLNKFIGKVDDKIHFRGGDCYTNRCVEELEYYENENLWEAVVSGSEEYYVLIKN